MSELTPEELGRVLREDENEFLRHRRLISELSVASIGIMGLISLFQLGAIKKLPDPPLAGFDSAKVNGSAEGYERFAVPDGTLGLLSYAATLVITAMGAPDRAQEKPLLPLAMLGKTAFDTALAAKLTYDQPTRQKAWCIYCLVSALATLGTLVLSVPEAQSAWRNWRGK